MVSWDDQVQICVGSLAAVNSEVQWPCHVPRRQHHSHSTLFCPALRFLSPPPWYSLSLGSECGPFRTEHSLSPILALSPELITAYYKKDASLIKVVSRRNNGYKCEPLEGRSTTWTCSKTTVVSSTQGLRSPQQRSLNQMRSQIQLKTDWLPPY